MKKNIDNYIDTAVLQYDFVLLDKAIAAGKDIESYDFGEQSVTVGCESIFGHDDGGLYASLVVRLLKSNSNAFYVSIGADNRICKECIAAGMGDRVKVVDDGYAAYAYKLDFFICVSSRFNRFLQKHNKSAILSNPFDFLPKPIRFNYINSFEKRFPFTFEFLAEREGVVIEEPFDYVRINYGKVLTEDEMKKHYESDAVGVDAYFEWLDLLIKNEKLRKRNAELGTLMLEWRSKYDAGVKHKTSFKSLAEVL